MAVHVLDGTLPSPLATLVDDYLNNCRARGLSPRTDQQYSYSLESIFLPWCAEQGITAIGQLDRRTVDRFTSGLLARRTREGKPVSKATVHTYVRPVRLMLTWADRKARRRSRSRSCPRRSKPVRDVLSRAEIDELERVMPHERDKLIIRIFGDCGPRLDELTRIDAADMVRSGGRRTSGYSASATVSAMSRCHRQSGPSPRAAHRRPAR